MCSTGPWHETWQQGSVKAGRYAYSSCRKLPTDIPPQLMPPMKLPFAMLSLRLEADSIGLAPVCEVPSPKPRDSCLPNIGLPVSTFFRAMSMGGCGVALPAFCSAEVRLEDWLRGEEEENLVEGATMSIGGEKPAMAVFGDVVVWGLRCWKMRRGSDQIEQRRQESKPEWRAESQGNISRREAGADFQCCL